MHPRRSALQHLLGESSLHRGGRRRQQGHWSCEPGSIHQGCLPPTSRLSTEPSCSARTFWWNEPRASSALEPQLALSSSLSTRQPLHRVGAGLFLTADHGALWRYPSIIALAKDYGEASCTFAQCMLGGESQKYTTLLYLPA